MRIDCISSDRQFKSFGKCIRSIPVYLSILNKRLAELKTPTKIKRVEKIVEKLKNN